MINFDQLRVLNRLNSSQKAIFSWHAVIYEIWGNTLKIREKPLKSAQTTWISELGTDFATHVRQLADKSFRLMPTPSKKVVFTIYWREVVLALLHTVEPSTNRERKETGRIKKFDRWMIKKDHRVFVLPAAKHPYNHHLFRIRLLRWEAR